jgi:hypothetical protein
VPQLVLVDGAVPVFIHFMEEGAQTHLLLFRKSGRQGEPPGDGRRRHRAAANAGAV